MKLLFFWLTAVAALGQGLLLNPYRFGSVAVTGDPIAATVNADGISATITFKGLATGGTYAYDAAGGSASLGLQQPSTAKAVLSISGPGFDSTGAATTGAWTSYATLHRRDPGTSNAKETTSGSDVIVEFALSEPVYAGETVSLTTLAGLYTQGGNPSTAKTISVVNNSTQAYFVPRGQWSTIDRQKFTGNFDLAFDPQSVHGVAGIACVKFDCTGGTSSATQSATVTSRTARQRAGSSLYSDEYKATIAIAGFTQGEDIACRVRVYPARGNTAFDSNSHSSDYLVQHNNTLTIKCDKTSALEIYGVVDNVSGNNGTGVASATLASARANPFQTVWGALAAGAVKVYLKNQVHTLTVSGSPAALGYWRVVTEDPTDPGAVASIPTGFVFPNTDYLKFESVTLRLVGNLSIFTGSTRYLWFNDVTGDANGQTLAANVADDIAGAIWTDCVIDPFSFKLGIVGNDVIRQSFDGCDFGSPGTQATIASVWRIVACKAAQNVNFSSQSSAVSSTTPSNVLIKNNRLLKLGLPVNYDAWAAATSDVFIIGNEFEGLTASLAGSPVFQFGQNSTEFAKTHCIVAHNTAVGERVNYLYVDGTAGAAVNHSRAGSAIVGNVFGNQCTKQDLFAPANAARIGGWWHDFGTTCYGNVARLSSFPPDYRGVGAVESNSDPLFTDDRSGSATGGNQFNYNANSGTGGGTYTISGGSPLLSKLPVNARHAAFTLRGTAIPNDGTAAAGANQL